MFKVTFVFNSGYQFSLECENFSSKRDPFEDKLISYKIEGKSSKEQPLFIKMSDVSCIISEYVGDKK